MYINDDITGLSNCLPVIFDSGASLTISPLCSDLIGSMTNITYLHLCGMVNGTIIEGKIIVEWNSCVGKQTLIVKSDCCYITYWNVWLIIPQQFFKRSTDITGKLICNEDHDKLEIWDHPLLKIEYDSNNHLPTATAHNAVIDSLIINMCLTYV